MHDIYISTRRLHLEKLRNIDAEIVFNYRSDDYVSRFQSFHPKSIKEINDFISNNTIEVNVENTWYQLGIYLINGELIGDFGIHFTNNEQKICEIGYTIRPEYQRRGYGKEAALGVIHYIFEEMKKDKIIASIDPKNEPSWKMLESMGFTIKYKKDDDIGFELSRIGYRLTIAST